MSRSRTSLWGIVRSKTMATDGKHSALMPTSKELLHMVETLTTDIKTKVNLTSQRGDDPDTEELARKADALLSDFRAMCFLLHKAANQETSMEENLKHQLIHLHKKLLRFHEHYHPNSSARRSKSTPSRSIFDVLMTQKEEKVVRPADVVEELHRRVARLYRGLGLFLVVLSARSIRHSHAGMDAIRMYAAEQLHDAEEKLTAIEGALHGLSGAKPWYMGKTELEMGVYGSYSSPSDEDASIPTRAAEYLVQDAMRAADLRSLLSSNSSFSFASISSHSIFSLPVPLSRKPNEGESATKHRAALVRECTSLLATLKRLQSSSSGTPIHLRVPSASALNRTASSTSRRSISMDEDIPAHDIAYSLHLLALGLGDLDLHEHAASCAQLAVDMYWMIMRKLEDGDAHLRSAPRAGPIGIKGKNSLPTSISTSNPALVGSPGTDVSATVEPHNPSSVPLPPSRQDSGTSSATSASTESYDVRTIPDLDRNEVRAVEGMEFALACARDTRAVCEFRLGRPEEALGELEKRVHVPRPLLIEKRQTHRPEHAPNSSTSLTATPARPSSPTHHIPHSQPQHTRPSRPKAVDPALSTYLFDILRTPNTPLHLVRSTVSVYESSTQSAHGPDYAWALTMLASHLEHGDEEEMVGGELEFERKEESAAVWDRAAGVYIGLIGTGIPETNAVYREKMAECEARAKWIRRGRGVMGH